MSQHSPVYAELDDFERDLNTRRSRSTDFDFLKEQERWNRSDRERQMVPYRDRDRNYYGATQRRTGADLLAVPVYETSRRRPRAHSDSRTPQDVDGLSRNFKTMEMRPSFELVSNRDEVSELVSSDGQHQRGSTHSKAPTFERPKIKIPPVIVQEHPPEQKSRAGPSASPRSPSGQPQLRDQYLVLQDKLADIILACVRYIDVEASTPQALTFEKISEQVKGFTFELKVWSQIANIQNMAIRDVPEDAKAVAVAASRNMERLIERASELHDACLEAKPSDLKFAQPERVEDEDAMFDKVGNEQ
jgi:hypothetical protein